MRLKYFIPSAFLLFACACAKLPIDPSLVQNKVNVQADSITFAIIGDYGSNSAEEGQVAEMVKGWNPDFIITTGDNNYPMGSEATIAENIGKYYCDYIYNPDAPEQSRCNGKAKKEVMNRFFPSPGNHDNYSLRGLEPYKEYFSLPGNEVNYEFSWGPVHFYSLNSRKAGNISCCDSPEAVWLRTATSRSTQPFNFVYFHHPPYSVSHHGSSTTMRWPYKDWGLDAVICGHEHVYERINDKVDKAPLYLVCGVSGNSNTYGCTENPLDTTRFSVVCDNQHFGAMRVKANAATAVFEFFSVTDALHPVDVYILHK